MMTPWRMMLYKELSKLSLAGTILDLGGSRKSGYHECFQGTPTFEVVNIDERYGYDHKCDLEQVLPLPSTTYDGALLINVLEHIYEYRQLMAESVRVVKPGGTLVIGVPFLMFVHPSPHDYARYTGETLTRLFDELGVSEVHVQPIGRGPGAVFIQLIGGVRGGVLWRALCAPSMWALDTFLSLSMSQSVLAERFPLGYLVTVTK